MRLQSIKYGELLPNQEYWYLENSGALELKQAPNKISTIDIDEADTTVIIGLPIPKFKDVNKLTPRQMHDLVRKLAKWYIVIGLPNTK